MALILVEGIDLTGKSTLAGLLADSLTAAGQEVEVRHSGLPEKRAIQEYVYPLLDYRPGAGRSIILDRGHIGEAVWPEVFDREPVMSPGERQVIERFMASRGAIYVYCMRDLESHLRAFAEADPPEPLAAALIPTAVDAYLRAFEDAIPLTVPYEHGDDRAEVAEKLAKASFETEDFVRPGIEITPAWAGRQRPERLLVTANHHEGLPLAVSEQDDWKKVAAVSTRDGRGVTPLRDLWNYLGRPQVIAGRGTEESCDQANLPRGPATTE